MRLVEDRAKLLRGLCPAVDGSGLLLMMMLATALLHIMYTRASVIGGKPIDAIVNSLNLIS
jgi:hypothetical protein